MTDEEIDEREQEIWEKFNKVREDLNFNTDKAVNRFCNHQYLSLKSASIDGWEYVKGELYLEDDPETKFLPISYHDLETDALSCCGVELCCQQVDALIECLTIWRKNHKERYGE